MGTLEHALKACFGHQVREQSVAQLLIIEDHNNGAQSVAHTLRQLMLQHMEQRTCLKKQVSVVHPSICLSSNELNGQAMITISVLYICSMILCHLDVIAYSTIKKYYFKRHQILFICYAQPATIHLLMLTC